MIADLLQKLIADNTKLKEEDKKAFAKGQIETIDKILAVLEKTFELIAPYVRCESCPIRKKGCLNPIDCGTHLKKYFTEQAEKELEGKE